ncbi:MAG: peptide chain release factor 2 [Oscillospiraceae bacterium]|nr:peptide chain release factor 2 [Oscillospiraceae bacterium]
MLIYDDARMRLRECAPSIEGLAAALGLDSIRAQLKEIEEKTMAQGFWDDPSAGQGILQKQKQLRDKLASYEDLKKLRDDTAELIALAEEMEDESVLTEVLEGVARTEATLASLKLATLLTGEYDSKNAILSFHAGAGGTEAQDWVQMLYRMYCHWAERHGYKVQVLDYLDGEEAGIKSVSISIAGANVYGYLRSEAGVHRLVRVSPFDSSGRRHTSFASLEVMPEIDEDNEINIDPADVKMDVFRSSGAGGQHVNKTSSAVRLTHLPTGIVVACQNERSQHQNREVAMKMLRSKLAEIKQREHLEKIEDIKGEQKEIGWGSQIRSYVFMPYTLVKDHRTGYELGNIGAVMDGDLDGFINAWLSAESAGNG